MEKQVTDAKQVNKTQLHFCTITNIQQKTPVYDTCIQEFECTDLYNSETLTPQYAENI